MRTPLALLRATGAARLYGHLGALVASLAVPASAQSPGDLPNVILIVVDDVGYGDLGAYSSHDARTPRIDSLAARGLGFTDFYAGGPVCTPSRYALLTGLHAFRADDPDLLGPLRPTDADSGIADSVATLADVLQEEGYETALIGKWHLGNGGMLTGGARDTKYHPLHHGFDHFFGLLGGSNDYNTQWLEDDFLDWWEGRERRPEDSLRYATQVFGDRVVAFLDEYAEAGTTESPFFLYLPFTASHYGQTVDQRPPVTLQLPIGEERDYLSRFDDLYPDDTNIRKRFLAMTAVLDDEIGRIVDALDRYGLMQNTIIWFVSDNGATSKYGGSNADLQGGKYTPYEGGIRVPSFVVWEGHIAPGVSAQVAGNVDVLPTVLRLAGVKRLFAVDGLDLSGHLLGGPAVARGIAVPNTRLGDVYRLGRWKYVLSARYGTGSPELYDLVADPRERRDLAAVYPDTVAALAALMPYGAPPPTPPDMLALRGGSARGEVLATAPGSLPAPPTAALRVVPNPSGVASGAVAELALEAPGPVCVEVFDALGRRVALLHDGPAPAGVLALGLGEHGLPAGVYVVRATAGGTVTSRVFTLVR
jgi:arylsulfatase A-like enzyme